MIEIREVKTKKEIKDFILFPTKLYKNNDFYVPTLYLDEKEMFKKGFTYSSQAEFKCFNAYKDNKIVGRIQGIIQHAANEKWHQKRIRFTRFDAIDDKEVSKALFDAVKNYGLLSGAIEIVGPLGFSDFEREGLLVEGFDQYQTFEEQYNFDYYESLILNYGFKKEIEWVESRLTYKKEYSERIHALSKKSHELYGLYRDVPNKGESKGHYIKRVAEEFFNIVDIGYEKIYGTVPFTPEMKKQVMTEFKLLLDPKYIIIIRNKEHKAVAMGLGFPTLTKIFNHTSGRLTLGRILKIFKSVKNPEGIDMGLVAVLPDYLNSGIVAPIIEALFNCFEIDHINFLETNLNLVDNKEVRALWKYFNENQNKKRRSYVYKIK